MDTMDDSIVFRAEYEIRAAEIDSTKKITVPSLMQLMQEASLKHIIVLKASIWDLKKSAWVLLVKEINVRRLPELGETVTIETYPAGIDRIFAFRDYRVFDAEGVCVADASSTWTLINLDTRNLERFPDHILHLPLPEDIVPLKRCKRKITIPEGGNYSDSFKVNYFHLDWNSHVNNVNYLKFILEVNTDKLKISTPSCIEIHFKAEALEDDELVIYNVSAKDNNETYHTVQNVKDDKVITQVKIKWDLM